MATDIREKLREELDSTDTDDIYRIMCEIDAYDGRFMLGDAGCPPMPTDEMLDLIESCDMSVRDVIQMVRYGNFENTDWLGLDGYGNFDSYSDEGARERFLEEADEIIDGILSGYADDSITDEMRDIIDGCADEDEDEDEEAVE